MSRMGLKTLPLTIFLQPVPLPPRLISMCAQKSSNDTSEVSSLAMQPTTGLSGHQLHPSDSSEASTDSTHATSTVGTKGVLDYFLQLWSLPNPYLMWMLT